VKLLTDLQILGCELHKNAFWRPRSARTRWGSYSAPQTSADIRGREAAEGERVGKGKGGLDLDICPGTPEFLVGLTPLQECVKTARIVVHAEAMMIVYAARETDREIGEQGRRIQRSAFTASISVGL